MGEQKCSNVDVLFDVSNPFELILVKIKEPCYSSNTSAMISARALENAGYVCIVMSVLGFLTNAVTFCVLVSSAKLRRQASTALVLCLTLVDVIYNGVMQPFHATSLIHCCHERDGDNMR